MTSEELHVFARQYAENLKDITMKLVRWNDIVAVAEEFYPLDPMGGVRECLQSCVPGDPMFDGKSTLAVSLRANYGWSVA